MRFNVHLLPTSSTVKLDIDYLYNMSAAVYKVFFNGSEKFAEWLHNIGFKDERGKPFKLFNYSYLSFDESKVQDSSLVSIVNPSFIFSSPLKSKLDKTFIDGIFKDSTFHLLHKKRKVNFLIHSIDILQEPIFSGIMQYKSKTPISVSIKNIHNGKNGIRYVEPSDKVFTESIKNNLLAKFKLVNEKDYKGKLIIEIPSDSPVKSKLHTFKNGKPEETKVRGFLTHINIEAEKEMQEIAYYCGVGEKNSTGFGMLEIIGGE